MSAKSSLFTAVRTEGALLPAELLNRVAGANYQFLLSPPAVNNPLLIGPWPWYLVGIDALMLGHDHLYPEDTRVSNPPLNVRGMTVNWFGHPLEPPQDHAIAPFDWPTSDARNAKDNHRPCVAEPIDPAAVLPPPAPENVPIPEFVFAPVPTIPHVQVAQPPREFKFIL